MRPVRRFAAALATVAIAGSALGLGASGAASAAAGGTSETDSAVTVSGEGDFAALVRCVVRTATQSRITSWTRNPRGARERSCSRP